MSTGPVQHKLTVHFGERARLGSRFFSDVILEQFARAGVASSVLMRAAGGFGLRHRLRTDTLLSLSEDPSVVAVAVDEPDVLASLQDWIEERCPRGMVVRESVRVLSATGSTEVPDLPGQPRLVVHLGRDARLGGVPAHVAVCALLWRHGVDGATVLPGVDGTVSGVRRRARFWSGNADVPARVVAVGNGAVLASVIPDLRALLSGIGPTLLATEQVAVCKRDGCRLASPPVPSSPEGWQRLTVVTSESRLHDGEPVHRGLVRRLRAGPGRGVTVQRGVWGYHGDHRPHGDRMLQWGRRVPVVTTTVDSADRIAESLAVADELTTGHGLIVVESVPWARHLG